MNFGFLIFNQAEELDIVGPWEMITMWSRLFKGPEHCFTVAQTAEPIECAKGLRLLPDYTFDNCPQLDYLLIPGGVGTRREYKNETLLNFIRQNEPHCEKIFSVCTGTFILYATGLLSGLDATTYWERLNDLRQFPDVNVREERFIRNEKIWLSAGVSSGIDMSLAFINEKAGTETASKVQLHTEYYPSGKKYGTEHLQEYAPAYART